jgi:hypothetical protein
LSGYTLKGIYAKRPSPKSKGHALFRLLSYVISLC